MRPRLDQIVINSLDPLASAQFWAELLGATVTVREGGWAHIERDGLPRFAFQPTDAAPATADAAVHVDIEVAAGELDAALDRAVAQGAARVGDRSVTSLGQCQTLRAPDGVVFCLVAD